MLIFVFSIIAAIIGMSFYQSVHGLEQFGTGFWTFITAVCGGEIVTFSLYRITKEKYERKAEKAAKENKTATITMTEDMPSSFITKNELISEVEKSTVKSGINPPHVVKENINGETKES